jgi:hypothetical protein
MVAIDRGCGGKSFADRYSGPNAKSDQSWPPSFFYSFNIDDSDLSCLLLSTIVQIFSVLRQHVAFLGGIDHSAIADDVPLYLNS